MSATKLRCIVVTPEETVLETEADFVVLPLYDGELGVGLNHSAMIGRLGFGELRIRSGQETTRYYVDGGFVQVADNLISVLSNQAIVSDAVDGEAAAEQLASSLGRTASGEEQIASRERSVAQARAQLRLVRGAK